VRPIPGNTSGVRCDGARGWANRVRIFGRTAKNRHGLEQSKRTASLGINDQASSFSIRTLRFDEIDASFIDAWKVLEQSALEPNAYLSPAFLLPAVRHLHRGKPPFLLAIFMQDRGHSTLVGLGAFIGLAGTRRFPLPHLVAFKSIHCYATGLLVDTRVAEEAVAALFAYLAGMRSRWHGIDFEDLPLDGPLAAAMLAAAGTQGVKWHRCHEYRRAMLTPHAVDEAYYAAAMQRSGGKDMARRIRRMNELGPVEWKIVRGREIDEAAIQRFLALEDREWARAQGSSLVAAGHDEFFREACAQFLADDRLFFAELTVAGKAIASACNFVSGDCGFAFKIGWDDALSRLSPGIINELWFLQYLQQDRMGLRWMDSGAQEGSFIEKIWAEGRPMASGIFAVSAIGRLVCDLCAAVRRLRAALRA